MSVSPSAGKVKLKLKSAENVVKHDIKEKNSLLLPPKAHQWQTVTRRTLSILRQWWFRKITD